MVEKGKKTKRSRKTCTKSIGNLVSSSVQISEVKSWVPGFILRTFEETRPRFTPNKQIFSYTTYFYLDLSFSPIISCTTKLLARTCQSYPKKIFSLSPPFVVLNYTSYSLYCKLIKSTKQQGAIITLIVPDWTGKLRIKLWINRNNMDGPYIIA